MPDRCAVLGLYSCSAMLDEDFEQFNLRLIGESLVSTTNAPLMEVSSILGKRAGLPLHVGRWSRVQRVTPSVLVAYSARFEVSADDVHLLAVVFHPISSCVWSNVRAHRCPVEAYYVMSAVSLFH